VSCRRGSVGELLLPAAIWKAPNFPSSNTPLQRGSASCRRPRGFGHHASTDRTRSARDRRRSPCRASAAAPVSYPLRAGPPSYPEAAQLHRPSPQAHLVPRVRSSNLSKVPPFSAESGFVIILDLDRRAAARALNSASAPLLLDTAPCS